MCIFVVSIGHVRILVWPRCMHPKTRPYRGRFTSTFRKSNIGNLAQRTYGKSSKKRHPRAVFWFGYNCAHQSMRTVHHWRSNGMYYPTFHGSLGRAKFNFIGPQTDIVEEINEYAIIFVFHLFRAMPAWQDVKLLWTHTAAGVLTAAVPFRAKISQKSIDRPHMPHVGLQNRW